MRLDRRRFLAVVGSVSIAGCSGSSDESEDGLRGPTSEDTQVVDLQWRDWSDEEIATVKDEADEVSYDELLRNAEDMVGEYVTATTVVGQSLEGPDANYTALLLVYDQLGQKPMYGSWTGDRYIRGDTVTYWGEVLGTETYETSQQGQLTVPAVTVADIELQEEADS